MLQTTQTRKHNRSIAMVLRAESSIPVLIFFIVTRTVTGPFRVQVDHRNYFSVFIALRKDNPYPLVILRYFLDCVARASRVLKVTLFVINLPTTHCFFNFFLCYVTTRHAAFCVFAVLQIGNAAVKTPVTIDIARRYMAAP